MTAKKTTETPKEIIKDVAALWEPWVNATRVWQQEIEKMQEIALDNMHRSLDDSHRVAKESLTMMGNFSNNVQKQINSQMDKSRDFFSNLVG